MTLEPASDTSNPDISFLVEQARKIIEDPEQMFDLVGRRLAFQCSHLKKDHEGLKAPIRIAVVGNPNRGKTTFTYSIHKILERYNFPSTYVDLDVFTNSGQAISGGISWEEIQKRPADKETLEKAREKIKEFRKPRKGIVLGDFPGRMLHFPLDIARLSAANIAIILAKDHEELETWQDWCEKSGTGSFYLVSTEDLDLKLDPLGPKVAGLQRRAVVSIQLMVISSSILEIAAEVKRLPIPDYEHAFSNPELVVLQEYLDILFSIHNR